MRPYRGGGYRTLHLKVSDFLAGPINFRHVYAVLEEVKAASRGRLFGDRTFLQVFFRRREDLNVFNREVKAWKQLLFRIRSLSRAPQNRAQITALKERFDTDFGLATPPSQTPATF